MMSQTFIDCFVLDNVTNECIVQTERSKKNMQLFWSDNLNTFPKNQKIGVFSGEKFKFRRVTDDNKRIYYKILFEDGHEQKFGERILKIPGMYNFRDMGGYPTKDGRNVKWGMLYRGDQLYNLESKGKNYLESLGLKTIIDFRSSKEIEEFPNKIPSTVERNYNFSPEAQVAMFAGKLQNEEFDNESDYLIALANDALKDDENAGDQHMIDQQRSFVLDNQAIEAFKNTTTKAIVLGNAPLFQHCKGGKDRTGFSAMIQLALLGVDKKYLVYDYMLTRKAREEKNKRYYENFLNLTQNKKYANYFYSLFDTKEEYIESAFKAIYENYDSIERFVMEVYKIGKEEIEEFKNEFLE